MTNSFFSRNMPGRAIARVRRVEGGNWAAAYVISAFLGAFIFGYFATRDDQQPRVRVTAETFGEQKVSAIDLDTWGVQLATSLNRADDLTGQVMLLASEACLISQTATSGNSDVVNAAELQYPALERLVGQIQGGTPNKVSVHAMLQAELAKRRCTLAFQLRT
jgi:hypothetical protein